MRNAMRGEMIKRLNHLSEILKLMVAKLRILLKRAASAHSRRQSVHVSLQHYIMTVINEVKLAKGCVTCRGNMKPMPILVNGIEISSIKRGGSVMR